MKKHLSQAGQENDPYELRSLLKIMLIEATPEASFEERFLYDFRDRVVREAVCRSAHSLIWEQLMMLADSIGIRRIVLGASTFSLGALCAGMWVWQQSAASARALATTSPCALEESARFLRPGDAQGVAGTTVRRIGSRKRSTTFFTPLAEEEDSISLTDEWNDTSSSPDRFSGHLYAESGNTPRLRF